MIPILARSDFANPPGERVIARDSLRANPSRGMEHSRRQAIAYAGVSGNFSPVTCAAAMAQTAFITSCGFNVSMTSSIPVVIARHAPGGGVMPSMANAHKHMFTFWGFKVCSLFSTASASAAAASAPGLTAKSANAHSVRLRFCPAVCRPFLAIAPSSASNAPGLKNTFSIAIEYAVLLTSCADM